MIDSYQVNGKTLHVFDADDVGIGYAMGDDLSLHLSRYKFFAEATVVVHSYALVLHRVLGTEYWMPEPFFCVYDPGSCTAEVLSGSWYDARPDLVSWFGVPMFYAECI